MCATTTRNGWRIRLRNLSIKQVGTRKYGLDFFINTSCFIIIYFTAAAFKSGKMTVPCMPGMPPGMRMPGFPGMPPPMSKNHFYIYLRALNRLDVTSQILTLELVTILIFTFRCFLTKINVSLT